jgi:hypothetical protein
MRELNIGSVILFLVILFTDSYSTFVHEILNVPSAALHVTVFAELANRSAYQIQYVNAVVVIIGFKV